MQQRVVLGLELYDERIKKKALITVSGFTGVQSVAVDMAEKKLTVVGEIDSVIIVKKLRKICHATILTVGPAKEPEKKDEPDEKPDPVIATGPPYPNYYCFYCQMFERPYCMCYHHL